MISLKDILGIDVIDQEGQNVGKVKNLNFDKKSGKINTLNISLNKGLFSKDEKIIKFNDIKSVSDTVLLNIVIIKED